MRGSEYDEQLQERQQQRFKKKINEAFIKFARQIEEFTQQMQSDENVTFKPIKFDVPLRKLAFKGVTQREMATIMPTVNCLVELVNYPFTVIFLEDIECVAFERVDFNIRNSDMVVIFKDLLKNPVQIKAIDRMYLETIQKWLEQVKIHVYELTNPINWQKIMKKIRSDPKAFYEDGGWSFLDVCIFFPGWLLRLYSCLFYCR